MGETAVGMKALRIAAGCSLALLAAACGDQGAADAPSMPDVVGQQLDVALADIESAGFEEDVDVVSDGTFGVINESNWTVCVQSPSAGRPITAAPELTVDRSCEEDVPESSAPPTESTTSAVPAPSDAPTTTAAPQETLTAANNAELAAILSEPDYCSDSIESFAATYGGQTIEFDGNVADVAAGGDGGRFTLLLYPGDFSETSAIGPAFQFQDVGISDLGPGLPDPVNPGLNVRVVARVQTYEPGGCLLLLEPVSMTPR